MVSPRRIRGGGKRGGRRSLRFLLFGALALLGATEALAQERFVKIGGLTDINFGLITNFSTDSRMSQSVCVYSAKTTPGYNVRAVGSGAGGAFTLAGGGGVLPYEVQWNGQAGQTSGTTLQPNVPRTGLVTTATQANCNNGPPATASLIVVIRSLALQSAPSGSFSGTLTVIVGAE